MQVLLETERLLLRRFVDSDVDHLFALDNDPEVMRYINGGTPTPREIIENDILPRFIPGDDPHPIYGFWAATEKESGHFVGWFSFRPQTETSSEIVLGYRLCRRAWGKGYASEGARLLIDRGFAEWGVQRVVATTYEENSASRRVMEKVGMTFRRAFRLTVTDIKNADTSHTTSDDLWDGDDVAYALERADWAQQQRQGCGTDTQIESNLKANTK